MNAKTCQSMGFEHAEEINISSHCTEVNGNPAINLKATTKNQKTPTSREYITQFELSKVTLKSLNKFKLSPTAKLVLLNLVDCYPNIFPAQKTIADQLGIGLSSVKRAIAELAKQGLIVYETKRFNNYKFTAAFFGLIKLTPERGKNETSKGVKMDYKQINEKTKNKPAEPDLKFNSYKKDKHRSYNKNYQRGYDTPEQQAKVAYMASRKRIEQTKDMMANAFNVERKSPMDDFETAKNWLESIDENQLKHSFICERVQKVREKWQI